MPCCLQKAVADNFDLIKVLIIDCQFSIFVFYAKLAIKITQGKLGLAEWIQYKFIFCFEILTFQLNIYLYFFCIFCK